MPICKLGGCIRTVCQFWLHRENFSFGLRFWHMDDRIYVHLFVGPDVFIWFLSYLLKDFPLFKEPKFYTLHQICDYRIVLLGFSKLFSQSYGLWSVKVNSNCFQRCFFYRKICSKWNFKNWSIMFFWNLTLISIYGTKNMNLHGIFLSPK